MTTSHTGNDNIIESDISDTELSEPENDLLDENSDDETGELVNDINILKIFLSIHKSLLSRIPAERFLENLMVQMMMIFNFTTI